MKMSPPFALLLAVFSAVVPPAQAMPESEAVPGRLLLRRYADAVVTIKGTVSLKVTMDDRPLAPQENKLDLCGTVITPTGLTVTSLSLIDPRVIFEALRAKMPGGGQNVTLGQTEFKDLKLAFSDGMELPVKLIWRDADRDVALLAPTAPLPAGRTLTCVNLNEAPSSAIVLGTYFELSRMNEALQRAPVVRPSTVIGIIERPRRMLLVNTEAVGCPVFDTQGRALGICLRLMVSNNFSGIVVVPSSDIVDIVGQISQL